MKKKSRNLLVDAISELDLLLLEMSNDRHNIITIDKNMSNISQGFLWGEMFSSTESRIASVLEKVKKIQSKEKMD